MKMLIHKKKLILTPGDYSDYDILEVETKLYPKMMKFGSKLKKRYGERGYC